MVNQYGTAPAIALTTVDDGMTPNVHMSLDQNHVDMREISPGSGRGPIGTEIRAANGSVCASVTNNISHFHPVGTNPQGGGIRATQSGTATFNLERGVEPLSATAQAALTSSNPAPFLSVMVTEAIGAFSLIENGSCVAPSQEQQ
jgi:hypothetical protein